MVGVGAIDTSSSVLLRMVSMVDARRLKATVVGHQGLRRR